VWFYATFISDMFGIFGGIVPCERGTCTSRQYCDQSGGDSIGYCIEPQMSSRGVCCSCEYAACNAMLHELMCHSMHIILFNGCHTTYLHLGHRLQIVFNRNEKVNCIWCVQNISEPKFLQIWLHMKMKLWTSVVSQRIKERFSPRFGVLQS
jgi:hypothetical protein